jgi:hypothetical protein
MEDKDILKILQSIGRDILKLNEELQDLDEDLSDYNIRSLKLLTISDDFLSFMQKILMKVS